MWINSTVSMTGLLSITATLSSGTYTVQAQSSVGAVTVGTYGSQGVVESVIDAVLATGYPWIGIGAVSVVANSQNPRVLAVNLDNAMQMTGVTDGEGSGLSFNSSWRSAGYAPWTNSADAIAAILALTGSVTV